MNSTRRKNTIIIGNRPCTVYFDPAPKYLLIQPTGEHEREHLDKEVEYIKSLTNTPSIFAAFEVDNWNKELSPWNAPPVFGKEPFGSYAGETLAYLEDTLIPEIIKRYSLKENIPVILGGYSLAGLFALWSAYTSDRFTAVAGVSPSVWFPRWLDFIAEHSPAAKNIYLSLGRKEEKNRNQTMAAVGDNIRRQYEMLKAMNLSATLEWNEGNHFTEPEIRTAKGFSWCINELTKENDT
ncbi:alpha/beta hydrolase [Ruminococcus albus]|uniref:Esterase n=1 Tax=Ruminococcus albus (strain ATCC 27210 / DSM 20455 / JCM 14654 / NCDO 2250 / 7) TaxID=697329 RepID=E6UKL9_RUMA7|nr:alpha/beta hydrolase-fold protein [Ruminococcus albus]ADU24215.1 hypothetical protein Rumal_3782 [Ruminococcus albus 7 = DSM 20455]